MDATTNQKINDFFSSYKKQRYDRGHIFARPGETMEYVFYIAEGMVREYDITTTGSEVVVNVLKPGAYFSVTQALIAEPNSWFYEALGDCKVRKAPTHEVVDFVQHNADVAFELLVRVSKGAHGLQRRMAHVMGGTARTQVLFELITEFSRFSTVKGGGKLEVKITTAELAKRCGLSRESVSRELKKLSSKQTLDKSYGAISVRSLDVLRSQLGEAV